MKKATKKASPPRRRPRKPSVLEEQMARVIQELGNTVARVSQLEQRLDELTKAVAPIVPVPHHDVPA